jgi:phosphoribosyl-ATP pyrophosphohydrolase
MADDILSALAATIAARRSAHSDSSYTRQLLDGGAAKCARKLGEEAVETILAALGGNDEELTGEAADLIYHLLVLLEVRQVPFADVLRRLEARMGQSGLQEKASRAQTKG